LGINNEPNTVRTSGPIGKRESSSTTRSSTPASFGNAIEKNLPRLRRLERATFSSFSSDASTTSSLQKQGSDSTFSESIDSVKKFVQGGKSLVEENDENKGVFSSSPTSYSFSSSTIPVLPTLSEQSPSPALSYWSDSSYSFVNKRNINHTCNVVAVPKERNTTSLPVSNNNNKYGEDRMSCTTATTTSTFRSSVSVVQSAPAVIGGHRSCTRTAGANIEREVILHVENPLLRKFFQVWKNEHHKNYFPKKSVRFAEQDDENVGDKKMWEIRRSCCPRLTASTNNTSISDKLSSTNSSTSDNLLSLQDLRKKSHWKVSYGSMSSRRISRDFTQDQASQYLQSGRRADGKWSIPSSADYMSRFQ